MTCCGSWVKSQEMRYTRSASLPAEKAFPRKLEGLMGREARKQRRLAKREDLLDDKAKIQRWLNQSVLVSCKRSSGQVPVLIVHYRKKNTLRDRNNCFTRQPLISRKTMHRNGQYHWRSSRTQ